MTFREIQPDLLSTTTSNHVNRKDGVGKRCKSMNDICKNSNGERDSTTSNSYNRIRIYYNNKNNTFLNRSFDQIRITSTMATKTGSPPVICRQESYHGDNDIELEPFINNSKHANHSQTRRCCSDPLPHSQHTRSEYQDNNINTTCLQIQNKKDSIDTFMAETYTNFTDGEHIEKHAVEIFSPRFSTLSTSAQESSKSISNHQPESGLELEKEKTKRRIQRRATELIIRHFPDVEESGELESESDEQLCHSIVNELKNIADSFDERHSGKNGFRALQETLNVDLTKLILPECLRKCVVPAIVKTSLNLALLYNRL